MATTVPGANRPSAEAKDGRSGVSPNSPTMANLRTTAWTSRLLSWYTFHLHPGLSSRIHSGISNALVVELQIVYDGINALLPVPEIFLSVLTIFRSYQA